MKASDICFYMSITKEENSSLLIAASAANSHIIPDEELNLTSHFSRKISFKRSTTTSSSFMHRLPTKGALLRSHFNNTSTDSNKKTSGGCSSDEKKLKKNKNKLSVDDTYIDNSSSWMASPTNMLPLSISTNNLDLSICSSGPNSTRNRTFENNKHYVRGSPPVPPYVGCSNTICHLLREKQPLCCLKLNQECAHSKATQIKG